MFFAFPSCCPRGRRPQRPRQQRSCSSDGYSDIFPSVVSPFFLRISVFHTTCPLALKELLGSTVGLCVRLTPFFPSCPARICSPQMSLPPRSPRPFSLQTSRRSMPPMSISTWFETLSRCAHDPIRNPELSCLELSSHTLEHFLTKRQ